MWNIFYKFLFVWINIKKDNQIAIFVFWISPNDFYVSNKYVKID
jgi:hypothetical protein